MSKKEKQVKVEDIVETKHDRFLRLSQPRVNKVLESIKILSHTANRSRYDYSDYEVEVMFDAIEKELAKARTKFDTGVSKEFRW